MRNFSHKHHEDFRRRLNEIHNEFYNKCVRQVVQKYYNLPALSLRELYNMRVEIFVTGNLYTVVQHRKELGNFIFLLSFMADEEVIPAEEATPVETPACAEGETCEAAE